MLDPDLPLNLRSGDIPFGKIETKMGLTFSSLVAASQIETLQKQVDELTSDKDELIRANDKLTRT